MLTAIIDSDEIRIDELLKIEKRDIDTEIIPQDEYEVGLDRLTTFNLILAALSKLRMTNKNEDAVESCSFLT